MGEYFRIFPGFRSIRESFLRKILRDPQCARFVYAGALRMPEGHTTYLIIGPEQSAKVIFAKFLFCAEMRKFSPSKVFPYTDGTMYRLGLGLRLDVI